MKSMRGHSVNEVGVGRIEKNDIANNITRPIRKLTDARIADQYRIILRPSAKYLYRPTYFVVPADYRIELPLEGIFSEVDAVLQ
jgi:hypothetical protein